MKHELKKTIAILEDSIRSQEEKKRSHDPFMVYQPWNILNDEHYLLYYPDGAFVKHEKMGLLSFEQVCAELEKYKESVQLTICMSKDTPWLFCFYCMSDYAKKLYTPIQLGSFVARDMQMYPELSRLFEDQWILDFLLKMPQQFVTTIGNWKQSVKKVMED